MVPRIRTIKPEFWTDEDVVELEFHERLLFIGLWNFADDDGFIEYKPKQIKMRIFPGDKIDIPHAVEALTERGMIEHFEADIDGVIHRLLHVTNWERHQAINRKTVSKWIAVDLRKRDQATLFQ